MKKLAIIALLCTVCTLAGCSDDSTGVVLNPHIDVNPSCNGVYTYDSNGQEVCCVGERVCLMLTSDEKCVMRVWSNGQYQRITNDKPTCNDEIYFEQIKNNNCIYPPSSSNE